MADYFDWGGARITEEAWATIRAEGNRLCRTVVGPAAVSTVWLGYHPGIPSDPPLIFETMIFGGDYDCREWAHATRREAEENHLRIVQALLAGRDPDEEKAAAL